MITYEAAISGLSSEVTLASMKGDANPLRWDERIKVVNTLGDDVAITTFASVAVTGAAEDRAAALQQAVEDYLAFHTTTNAKGAALLFRYTDTDTDYTLFVEDGDGVKDDSGTMVGTTRDLLVTFAVDDTTIESPWSFLSRSNLADLTTDQRMVTGSPAAAGEIDVDTATLVATGGFTTAWDGARDWNVADGVTITADNWGNGASWTNEEITLTPGTATSGTAHGNTIRLKAPDGTMTAEVKEIVGFSWNSNDTSDDGTMAPVDDTSTSTINESLALSGVNDIGSNSTIDERYVSISAPGAVAVTDDPSTTDVDEGTLYEAYAAAVPRSVSDHLMVSGQPAPDLTWIDTSATAGIQGATVSGLRQILELLETFVKDNSVAAVAGEFTITGEVEASTYIWIDSNGNGQATSRNWDDDLKKQVVDMDPGDLYLKLVGVDNIYENANHHLFISGVTTNATL